MNWDLTHLYKSEKDLEKEIEVAKKEANKFQKKYKGQILALKRKDFMEVLNKYEAILSRVGKALTYVYLTFSTDARRGDFLAKYQQEATEIEDKLLFFELEFNQIESKKQAKIIEKAEEKSFYLESLAKEKKHQLSLLEEKILLKKDLTSSSAFSRLFDEHFSRLKFNFQGKEVAEEVVLSELYNKNRKIRKEASESLTNGLKPHLSLLAYIFNMIKTDLKIESDLRSYKSPEHSRHISNKITQKSVDSLVNITESNTNLVSQYYDIKKELLNLDKLYDYDRYAPISTNSEDGYDFEKSKTIVLEAFKNFDEKFYEIAKKAFDENWIDVYPKENKRGGAFSHSATSDTHPYILLNHTDRRRDLFTLAHELGHTIHQYLSKDVGYLSQNTPLTTAETASVFAEMIVFDYIKNDLKNSELIALYGSKLEDIFATLYRQIIFTTFERSVHSFDGELKIENFNELWLRENQKMFGKSVELTENYNCWWSYIPHFIHSPFYCYAYSYGQLLVLALYGLYKSEKIDSSKFKELYLTFLKSGGSKSPKDLIALFDLDIEDENFWKIGIEEVKSLLKEFREVVIKDLKVKNRYVGSSFDKSMIIEDIIKSTK